MTTINQQAFELGMHSAFKKAGVKTAAEANELFGYAEGLLTQRQAAVKAAAAYELGLRKTAADNGLLTTEEQDAFVEATKKVAAEKIQKRQKTAALGAIIGSLRKKDPGESRGKAILRSAGTDLATTAGGTAGAGVGGIAGLLAGLNIAKAKGLKGMAMTDLPLRKPQPELVRRALQRLALGGGGLAAGALGGAGLGAAGAYQLAKRKPQTTGQKIKGNVSDLRKKVMHLLGK
jgi:hypothetical protein